MKVSNEAALAYKKANDKLKNMTDDSLIATWQSLNTKAAWINNVYNEHITLDEWADIVYSEMGLRNIPAI